MKTEERVRYSELAILIAFFVLVFVYLVIWISPPTIKPLLEPTPTPTVVSIHPACYLPKRLVCELTPSPVLPTPTNKVVQ